ncbi:Major facilitator superfamily like protein [Aduncisulcus paluster]|uniref:Major facilitator superfamily like protein n=1 Tax=Aduncisulcus paluster TaxID=2918883 RepID=A0ABQ5K3T6_9EUKA|nr:Major facilitator superfamily like protein [Aduncisulcus paluster]
MSNSDSSSMNGQTTVWTTKKFLILNSSMAGLQFGFAIMSSFLSPYLSTQLQFPNYVATLTWCAGPLCGFFVQPLVGSWSDATRSNMGRRRPWIIFGAAFLIFSLLFLGFSYAMGSLVNPEDPTKGTAPFAIIGAFLVNAGLNIMLAPCRAIVADLVPEKDQEAGSGWSAFMVNFSYFIVNVIFYITSFWVVVGEPEFITLMEIMTTVACFVIIGVCIPTLKYGTERPLPELIREGKVSVENTRGNVFSRIFRAFRTMPKPFLMTCIVFFFSWAGYFPYMIIATQTFGMNAGTLANSLTSLAGIIYTPFYNKLAQQKGEKSLYLLSQGIMFIAFFILCFFSDTLAVLYICAFAIGLNVTTMNAAPFSIIGKSNTSDSGLYAGALNACCVLAQLFIQLVTFICEACGWDDPSIVLAAVFSFCATGSCLLLPGLHDTIAAPADEEGILLVPSREVSEEDNFGDDLHV